MAAYIPSDNLRAALEAERELANAHAEAARKLHAAIAEEVRAGAKNADVARAVHYHPGHIARIARAHGVPGDPSRTPPRRTAAE